MLSRRHLNPSSTKTHFLTVASSHPPQNCTMAQYFSQPFAKPGRNVLHYSVVSYSQSPILWLIPNLVTITPICALSQGRRFWLLPDAVCGVLQGRHALLPARQHLQLGEGHLRFGRCKLGECWKMLPLYILPKDNRS